MSWNSQVWNIVRCVLIGVRVENLCFCITFSPSERICVFFLNLLGCHLDEVEDMVNGMSVG